MTLKEIGRKKKNVPVNPPLFFRFFQGCVSTCSNCGSDRIRKIFDMVRYENLKGHIKTITENERYVCCKCRTKGNYEKVIHDEGILL